MYNHLQQGTILFDEGEFVFAGQKIAESGNSGISCGGHLHYILTNSEAFYYLPANSLNPGGKWTTDRGACRGSLG